MESKPAPDVESGLLGDAGSSAVESPGVGLTASLNSVEFAYLARTLCAAAEELDVSAPSFRSPPAAGGAGRSIRRSRGQRATVAVRYRGRPSVSVAADMVEGILQSASQPSAGARRADFTVRDRLWEAAVVALGELMPREGLSDAVGSGSVERRAA